MLSPKASTCSFIFAIFLFSSYSANAYQLPGCYKSTEITRIKRGGEKEISELSCTRLYTDDQYVSQCSIAGKSGRMVNFIYKVEKPGVNAGIYETYAIDSTGNKVGSPVSTRFYSTNNDLKTSATVDDVTSIYDFARVDIGVCNEIAKSISTPSKSTSVGQAGNTTAQDTGSALVNSSNIMQGGKYGAPDLLGFKIGMGPQTSFDNRIGQMSKEGYKVTRERVENSLQAVQMISLAKTESKKTKRPFYEVEASYLRLAIDADNQIRVIVRGETFVNMPYIRDFVPILKEKLNPPPWVVEALLARGQSPQLFEKTERETVWGSASGKAVRFNDCFQINHPVDIKRQEYQPGGWQTHYYDFYDVYFKSLKPNYCQYAIAIHTHLPIYGDDTSLVIASYAVTVIDLEKTAAIAIAANRKVNEDAAAEQNRLRNSATRPKL